MAESVLRLITTSAFRTVSTLSCEYESASSSVILNFNSNNDRSHSFHTDSVVGGLVVWFVLIILHFNRI